MIKAPTPRRAEHLVSGCYLADLVTGEQGYYAFATAHLRYYSDGSEWFFDAQTGEPAFYRDGGVI